MQNKVFSVFVNRVSIVHLFLMIFIWIPNGNAFHKNANHQGTKKGELKKN
jgi:hypothetical protein